MSLLDVRSPAFHALVPPDASAERIAGGLAFTEGPVWRGTDLLFSDLRNKRIARWRRLPEGPELTTWTTGHSNGLTLDQQGRVLAAEHGGRRVTRIGDDGTRTVVAERFQGMRLNSPNDIVVKSDGSVYFTDPPYAVQPGTPGMARPANWWSAPMPGKELSCNGVYRLAPDGGPDGKPKDPFHPFFEMAEVDFPFPADLPARFLQFGREIDQVLYASEQAP